MPNDHQLNTDRVARWSWWLVAGVLFGLGLGFLLGLAKPRARER